jgi:hypothetical protein
MDNNKLIFYTTPQGDVKVEVVFEGETFWLTQKAIAELFGVEVPAISKHLNNIYETGELTKEATVSILERVQNEGNRKVARKREFYSLDAIIAVGYRVNSKKATQFRIWATQTLKEFITKGFVLNDEMLKNGKTFGKDYFDELLERIREIRTSERRSYQKLTDIFEQCSSDYSPNAEESKLFYAMVQNKLHFAITGKTAAEVIISRADSKKANMGLTSWKNSPHGKILKSDTLIAKNYLSEIEISNLNLLVNAYLDLAELQARRKILMSMKDWVDRTNKFLDSNSFEVLENAGNASHELAIKKAEKEYEIFRVEQDKNFVSEFDRIVKKIDTVKQKNE